MSTAEQSLQAFPGADALLDFYLAAYRDWWDAERPQARATTTGWRASELGSCLQAQYRARLGEPPTRVIDASTRRAFAWGDMIEDFYAQIHQRLGLVEARQIPLRDEELGLSGHLDLLLRWPPQPVEEIPAEVRDGWSEEWLAWLRHIRGLAAEQWPVEGVVAVEIKSTHSYALPHLVREGGPRYHHAVQLGAYRLLASRNPAQLPALPDRWRLDYVGKDSVGVVSFGIPSRWADEALARVSELNRYLQEERDPSEVPCTCEGWQVEYCRYLRHSSWQGTQRHFVCCDGSEYRRAAKRGESRREGRDDG